MIASITKRITMTRGTTYVLSLTARDINGARVSLTGATSYAWVRADLKLATPQIQLASAVTAAHRIGIVHAVDQTATPGDLTVTFIPADTIALLTGGASDPYFWGLVIKDVANNQWSFIDSSPFELNTNIVTTP